MKIDKVTYQKAYVIGPYLQERVGFEASIDGDSPEEVLTKLRNMADDWHKENNPHLGIGADAVIDIQQPRDAPIEDRVKALVQDINNETALRGPEGVGGLMAWKFLVDRTPALKEAFDKKFKELSNV